MGDVMKDLMGLISLFFCFRKQRPYAAVLLIYDTVDL